MGWRLASNQHLKGLGDVYLIIMSPRVSLRSRNKLIYYHIRSLKVSTVSPILYIKIRNVIAFLNFHNKEKLRLVTFILNEPNVKDRSINVGKCTLNE